MTVAELIEKLQQYPPSMRVFVHGYYEYRCLDDPSEFNIAEVGRLSGDYDYARSFNLGPDNVITALVIY